MTSTRNSSSVSNVVESSLSPDFDKLPRAALIRTPEPPPHPSSQQSLSDGPSGKRAIL